MKANNVTEISSALRRPMERVKDDRHLEVLTALGIKSGAGYPLQSAALEMVLPHVKDGIVVCDSQGLIILASAGAKQLARQDPEGKSLDVSEDIWGELFDQYGSHLGLEDWPISKALRGESIAYQECRLVRPNGTADILFSANPIVDLAHRVLGAVATLTDISQRKREETIQHEQALERERSRMATLIHDSVSQSLTAIALQLQTAEYEIHQNSSDAGVYLQRAISLARESLADLRRCIWALSHESLEGEDLAEALSFLAEQLFTSTPIELKLSLQRETEALPREVRHEMLWISKEALANVLKHAQATKVHVQLRCRNKNKEVRLTVDDNGQGFGPVRGLRNGKGSFGLISMRKRALRLGGTVVVDSRPGKGTRVVAVVPCQH